MAYGRYFSCPECTEEFFVSAHIEYGEDTLLVCPVCGSIDIEPTDEAWVQIVGAAGEAAA